MSNTTVAWKRSSLFDEILYRFEKDYRAGNNPDMAAYLTGEGEVRWQLLMELLHSDLELRLRAGEQLRVRDYFAKFPELAERPADILSLLAPELLFLKERGQQPVFEEYEANYGKLLPSSLKPLFEQSNHLPGDRNLGKLIANRYKLISVLGQGGMGTVYLAEQSEPVKRQVALKLISAGIDSRNYITRFEAERQALAVMDHPNIARVYDGGTTDQHQPFFVMELVQGIPITQYCDQQKLNPKARLELFVQICQAVQHAHQKGIIHRDLKPGNVLVTTVDGKPVPKVIDFGLAKATEQPLTDETIEERGAVGTPAYMSPEQADPENMDVDTRTDVYALGVILYELLTGHTPIDVKQFRRGALLEMLRMVREVDPPKPSTKLSSAEELPSIAANRAVEPKELLSWIRGDIDWIVMKALEKDRNRRYETANGFAADVQRYLSGEAVLAHPPSRWYRMKKFVKRNRVQVVAAGLVLVTLIIGLTVSLWQMNRAIEAEKLAQNNASVAKNKEDEARRLLGISMVNRGLLEIEHGNLTRGLLWFAEQGNTDSQSYTASEIASRRIGTWMRLEKYPKLINIIAHEGPVRDIAFSPDGGRILTASKNTAQIWDVNDGNPTSGLMRHNFVINHSSFSPNGNSVLTASSDFSSRLWDSSDGLARSPQMVHRDQVLHAVFSPQGDRLVTTSNDHRAIIWDARTGEQLTPPLSHQGPVKFAAFSPDGNRIITASTDKTARIWDANNGMPVTPVLQHRDYVNHAVFSPDGLRVITSSNDSTSRIWDAKTGDPIYTFRHNHWALISSFSHDGNRVITASADGTAILCNCKTGYQKISYLIHNGPILSAEFSPDDMHIVTASQDNSARVWEVSSGIPVTPPLLHQGGIIKAIFSPDGSRVATASADCTIRIWDIRTVDQSTVKIGTQDYRSIINITFSKSNRKTVLTSANGIVHIYDTITGKPCCQPIHQDQATFAKISNDERYVIIVSKRTAQMWDTITGASINEKMQHLDTINSASFSSDDRYVVTSSSDGSAVIWDAKTCKQYGSPLFHGDKVMHAMFNHDASRVVTASFNKNAQVWNVHTSTEASPPMQHKDHVNHALFSPDGKHIATSCKDNTVQIWDISSGITVARPLIHNGAIRDISFSADAKLVVTASQDNSARVWNANNGLPVSPSLHHSGPVLHASFSPDNRFVVTASADSTAVVWDATTGQQISPRLKHYGYVLIAAFCHSGDYIITGSSDGAVMRWDISKDNKAVTDTIQLCRVLASGIIDQMGSVNALNINAELMQSYNKLRSKYPNEFTPNHDIAIKWRMKRITDSCKNNNLTSAVYHYNWLIADAILNYAQANRR